MVSSRRARISIVNAGGAWIVGTGFEGDIDLGYDAVSDAKLIPLNMDFEWVDGSLIQVPTTTSCTPRAREPTPPAAHADLRRRSSSSSPTASPPTGDPPPEQKHESAGSVPAT